MEENRKKKKLSAAMQFILLFGIVSLFSDMGWDIKLYHMVSLLDDLSL